METLEQIEANVEQTAQGNESPFEDNITVAQSPNEVVAETNENPVLDEDTEARKFQSMYDRSQAELGELKKYEPLVDLLETRPDLVKVLQDNISNPSDEKQSSPAVEVRYGKNSRTENQQSYGRATGKGSNRNALEQYC